jgi:hypothetical protein
VKRISIALVFLIATVAWGQQYPTTPNPEITPGSLCTHPTSYRYKERIPYCERAVPSRLKEELIEAYDHRFGFHIGSMNRRQFKIDHFIPLCAGGSNDANNLWPQHQNVYRITDPLEEIVCVKMLRGKLKQVDAVKFIRAGKTDLKRVDELIRYLETH